MSLAAITWAMAQHVGNSSAKFVLVAMADRANKAGVCWPSVENLAEITHQNRKTVHRALRVLVDLQLIQIKNNPGSANHYVLNLGHMVYQNRDTLNTDLSTTYTNIGTPKRDEKLTGCTNLGIGVYQNRYTNQSRTKENTVVVSEKEEISTSVDFFRTHLSTLGFRFSDVTRPDVASMICQWVHDGLTPEDFDIVTNARCQDGKKPGDYSPRYWQKPVAEFLEDKRNGNTARWRHSKQSGAESRAVDFWEQCKAGAAKAATGFD